MIKWTTLTAIPVGHVLGAALIIANLIMLHVDFPTHISTAVSRKTRAPGLSKYFSFAAFDESNKGLYGSGDETVCSRKCKTDDRHEVSDCFSKLLLCYFAVSSIIALAVGVAVAVVVFVLLVIICAVVCCCCLPGCILHSTRTKVSYQTI